MDTAAGIVFLVGLGAALVAALVAGWRATHGVHISTVGLLVATGVWIIAMLAVAHDYHDADGWVDCWPSCSALQQGVAIGLIGGLVMMAAFAAAFVLAVIRRAARRQGGGG